MSFLQGYARKLGVMEYLGVWDASTNTPTLSSSSGQKGGYYIVSIAGTTELDGIDDWGASDWLVFNGQTWEKIDNSEEGYNKQQVDALIVEAKDRSFHTGNQLSETIADLTETVQNINSNMLETSNDLEILYPNENGKIEINLKSVNITPGTYNSVSVDSKGRVISGIYTQTNQVSSYVYTTSDNNSTTLTNFINIPDLTTVSLPIGLYKFTFLALVQSTATTTGVGVKLSAETASISTIYGKYSISQSVPGTTQSYEYDQISQNTNVTSVSASSTAFGFVIRGEGVVRVTSAGSLAMQFRSEVADSAVVIKPDAILNVELIV